MRKVALLMTSAAVGSLILIGVAPAHAGSEPMTGESGQIETDAPPPGSPSDPTSNGPVYITSEPITEGLLQGADMKKPPTTLSYQQLKGGNDRVAGATSWTVKDQSVTSETPAQVVNEAEAPVRQVVTIDSVDGKPVVTTTPVTSEAQAEAVVAKEQKQPETIAVSVDTPIRISGDLSSPHAAYYWALTSSSDPMRAEQRRNYDIYSPHIMWGEISSWAQIEYPWSRGRGQGVTVAVIDTGVDGTHPDLAGQVLPGYDFVSGATGSQAGWDDANSHGTHVAGIIAAKDNNGVGITGVAPDVKILPVRVMGADGSGMSSTVAKGVIRAVEAGAHVINMSIGAVESDPVLQTAVEWAASQGVIIVAAGGNLGMPGYIVKDGWQFPATYKGVIGVASSESDCGGVGGTHIDISAPGCAVLSTIPRGGYARYSGTSMATPQVAGEAALLLSAGIAPSQVEAAMKASSTTQSAYVSWVCTLDEGSTETQKSYTCVPGGTDWDLTRLMFGAGTMSPVLALEPVGGNYAQGQVWPAVSTGTPAAARPVTVAPSELPAPEKLWTPPTLPSPSGLHASGSYRNSVTLTWDELEKARHYKLEVQDPQTQTVVTKPFISTDDPEYVNSTTVKKLTYGKGYQARIQAYLSNGKTTGWSEWIDLILADVPEEPAAPVITSQQGSVVNLTALTPSGATGMEMRVTDKADNEVVSTLTAPAGSSGTVTFAVEGLTRGGRYTAEVHAVSPNGFSAWSGPRYLYPVGLNMPKVSLTGTGNLTANVSWAPDDLVTAWRVNVVATNVPDGIKASLGSRAMRADGATVTRLTNGVTYKVSVTASAAGQKALTSQAVEFTARAVAGPASVSMVPASAVTAQVSFAAVERATAYRVCLTDETGATPASCSTTHSSPVLKSVKAAHTYLTTVSALVDGAYTQASGSKPVYVKAVPLKPAATRIKEVTGTSITVTLPAVRIPAGAPALEKVRIRYVGLAGTVEHLVNPGTLTDTATGLRPGTTYSIGVAGVNSDGAGDESFIAAVTSTLAAPSVTRSATGITWTSTGVTSYRVSFEDASGKVLTTRLVRTTSLASSAVPSGTRTVRVQSVQDGAYSDWSAPLNL